MEVRAGASRMDFNKRHNAMIGFEKRGQYQTNGEEKG